MWEPPSYAVKYYLVVYKDFTSGVLAHSKEKGKESPLSTIAIAISFDGPNPAYWLSHLSKGKTLRKVHTTLICGRNQWQRKRPLDMGLKTLASRGSTLGSNSRTYEEIHMKGYDKGAKETIQKILVFNYFRKKKKKIVPLWLCCFHGMHLTYHIKALKAQYKVLMGKWANN